MTRIRLAVLGIAIVIGFMAIRHHLERSPGTPVADGSTVSGTPFVIDGDTLRFGTVHVRLWGIDAPEKHQSCGSDPCGLQATDAMRRLIGSDTVRCSQRDIDRYKRVVATCSAGGRDLGSAMVSAGMAVDYEHYSHRAYHAEQEQARNARRGIWAGDFEMPADWRREHHR